MTIIAEGDQHTMSERTNHQRAASAAEAVRAYARDVGVNEDAATHISDLICDLAHLADHHGLDPIDLIKRGLAHHAAELADAAEQLALGADHCKACGATITVDERPHTLRLLPAGYIHDGCAGD